MGGSQQQNWWPIQPGWIYLSVSVIGSNAHETLRVIKRLCQAEGHAYEADDTSGMPRILLVQGVMPGISHAVSQLSENDFLLVNADEKEIFTAIVPCSARLITFGFNAKVCVTASSVTDNAVQICVQRGFISAGGRPHEAQEFSVSNTGGEDAASVLGAVTACMVCDIL